MKTKAAHARWDECVAHRGDEAQQFLTDYFGDVRRNVLLVAGAGFDARASVVTTGLARAEAQVFGLFIREDRPNAHACLVDRATRNMLTLCSALPHTRVIDVDVFDDDGAVVGGRRAVRGVAREDLSKFSDVVIDPSALSVGISFPLVRYFLDGITGAPAAPNVHVLVTHNPGIDGMVRSTPSENPGYVHGFRGDSTLSESSQAARLWLPQLAPEKHSALALLHDFVGPDDTCPILPFPAGDPRSGDLLVKDYRVELEETWSVDTSNLVYADEGDPLDLYRTILKLDRRRKGVFAETHGSMLVLSPLGSKVMALGALMAAVECDLPVAYVEPAGYEVTTEDPPDVRESELIHIWLGGEVYS